MLAGIVVAVLAAVIALILVAGLFWATGERVRGAADLAALAGAQAQGSNADACSAARASAGANGAELTACALAGDEVEFVVSVAVRRRVGWGADHWLSARANAGVVTGAPE